MSQSQVPTAPNLDILTETVADTGAGSLSGGCNEMRRHFTNSRYALIK
jgi:hypothetical protein